MMLLVACYTFAIVVTTVSAVWIRHRLMPTIKIEAEVNAISLDERVIKIELGLTRITELLQQRDYSSTEVARTSDESKDRAKEISEELTAPDL